MLSKFLSPRTSKGNYNLVSLNGGRYYVNPGDKEAFYKAFEHDMKNWDETNYQCITYRPCVLAEDNPLYIDIDLRYKDARPINLELYKTFAGGKIDKVKKREKKKDAKVEEAINTTFTGGKIKKKFHNRLHKHLHENLTGKGGRFDSPFVRKKMHELMTKHGHPKIFQSYITGRYNNFHEDPSDTLHGPPKPVRRDSIAHVIDTGGSLKKLTHSEGGFLQSYDSKWYSHVEIV